MQTLFLNGRLIPETSRANQVFGRGKINKKMGSNGSGLNQLPLVLITQTSIKQINHSSIDKAIHKVPTNQIWYISKHQKLQPN